MLIARIIKDFLKYHCNFSSTERVAGVVIRNSWQCLHFIASSRMFSEQNGHFFIFISHVRNALEAEVSCCPDGINGAERNAYNQPSRLQAP